MQPLRGWEASLEGARNLCWFTRDPSSEAWRGVGVRRRSVQWLARGSEISKKIRICIMRLWLECMYARVTRSEWLEAKCGSHE